MCSGVISCRVLLPRLTLLTIAQHSLVGRSVDADPDFADLGVDALSVTPEFVPAAETVGDGGALGTADALFAGTDVAGYGRFAEGSCWAGYAHCACGEVLR
jgi:hypothetical protein